MSLVFALLLAATTAAAPAPASLPDVKAGDIVFQTSKSDQSVAIQRATHSKYSHVGVVLVRDEQPLVLEAADSVRVTPLADWLEKGTGGHYVVKRLRGAGRLLDNRARYRLNVEASRFEGRPYDAAFGWSDERLYCSELVYKLFDRALRMHLGDEERLGDLDLTDAVVKAKLKERYGDKVPLDEKVVTPESIFQSTLLEIVVEK